MTKRRITKASKSRLLVFGSISLFFIVYFCFSFISNGYNIYTLTKQKKELENTYIKLQEKAEELKLDIQKLHDPEYLADYARENYLYSKDDEYIIQIDEIIETEEKIDTISTKINKGYILSILILLIVLIFVYIIIKSNGKTKKK